MDKKENLVCELLDGNLYYEMINNENYQQYEDLMQSIDYLRMYSGGKERENNELYEEIKNPRLPPKGKIDQNHIHGIVNSNNEPVAWVKFYEGFPNHKTIFLGEFYIHKNKQQNGIGTSILKSYELYWKENGYDKVLLNVDLKNWEGLQFWIKNDYRYIEKFHGDKSYSTETYAMLRLSKQLVVNV